MSKKYIYIRGTEHGDESVEFEITTPSGAYAKTICVVNVRRLLNGVSIHPCGSGEDYKLDAQTLKAVLETVKSARSEIKYCGKIKTLDDWRGSGLNLDEYLVADDKVDEDLVDDQMNCVPPHRLKSGYLQVGEPYCSARDESGRYRPTYATFYMCDSDTWKFAGYCFTNDCINRVKDKGVLPNVV